jgi:CRP-like cAMP-binding protein
MSETESAPGSFLSLLEPSERDALSELGIPRSFPRGSVLMFQQEPGERVMILLEGRVKVSRIAEDGREALLDLRDPGDVVGELALVDGQPRLATVTALDPVRALVIPSSTLSRHLETTPRVALVLLQSVTTRFREATSKLLEFTTSDTLGRLSARLVELAERYGEPNGAGITVALPLSQEELCAWTGASRTGVAYALHELRKLGWISTGRRQIVVRDLDALRTRAA